MVEPEESEIAVRIGTSFRTDGMGQKVGGSNPKLAKFLYQNLC